MANTRFTKIDCALVTSL